MTYRFLSFVLLLIVTIFYIGTDGLTHRSFSSDRGSYSWDGGNAGWEMERDESSDHPTITSYSSANVTRYKREDTNGSGSGSGSEDKYDEYALGHASVSAKTLTITIGGVSETHEPIGKVSHKAFVHFTYPLSDGSKHYHVYKTGANNVTHTKYRGEYNQGTSAYNSYRHIQSDTIQLTGEGRGGISNIVEEYLGAESLWGDNTNADTWATFPKKYP